MDARDKIIEDIKKLIVVQSQQIAKLTARVAELELPLDKATKDSLTSSKPPSSDITKPKTSTLLRRDLAKCGKNWSVRNSRAI